MLHNLEKFLKDQNIIAASRLGLLISSIVADGKTAANIVPLILIPQIILGGALIKYEEMNRNLDFIYTINRWFAHHPESARQETKSELEVPFICQFMPMRWSYEALVVVQGKLNPLTSRQERIQRRIEVLKSSNDMSWSSAPVVVPKAESSVAAAAPDVAPIDEKPATAPAEREQQAIQLVADGGVLLGRGVVQQLPSNPGREFEVRQFYLPIRWKMPQNPHRPVHALLAGFLTSEALFNQWRPGRKSV